MNGTRLIPEHVAILRKAAQEPTGRRKHAGFRSPNNRGDTAWQIEYLRTEGLVDVTVTAKHLQVSITRAGRIALELAEPREEIGRLRGRIQVCVGDLEGISRATIEAWLLNQPTDDWDAWTHRAEGYGPDGHPYSDWRHHAYGTARITDDAVKNARLINDLASFFSLVPLGIVDQTRAIAEAP